MRIRHANGWLFVISLAIALFLLLLPLPGVLRPFKPYWPILVLTYWVMVTPGRVSLGLAFAVGLAADLLNGALLGDQALRLTIAVYLLIRFRTRLRFFPMWQQMLVVGALLLNNRVLELIIRLFAGQTVPPWPYWGAPVVGALLWPLVFLLLDDLHARIRVREA